MKVAVLGGGGFRTPLTYAALLDIAERVGITEVVLHDVAAARLESIAHVLAGIAAERGDGGIAVRATVDLDDAVAGAAFVLCAIRVGGLPGRVVDERVPREFGVLGQETIGPGGICFALRSLPVMRSIAEAVARRAPRAWLINFTNPVGLLTEALQGTLGERAIGVCDTPADLCRRVAAVLGAAAEELWFDYVGLNHLGWLRGVRDATGDRLPGLLADPAQLAQLTESAVFGAARLREWGMIPNEYLHYFDAPAGPGDDRASYLLHAQSAFYAERCETPGAALAAWRSARAERERTYMAAARAGRGAQPSPSPGYADVAASLVEALGCNSRRVLILDVANSSSVRGLDEEAVVEVPCVVGAHGAVPVAMRAPSADCAALMRAIKDVERLTMRASETGSRALAVQALAAHPLVPSTDIAARIFARYCAELPGLGAQFGSA